MNNIDTDVLSGIYGTIEQSQNDIMNASSNENLESCSNENLESNPDENVEQDTKKFDPEKAVKVCGLLSLLFGTIAKLIATIFNIKP